MSRIGEWLGRHEKKIVTLIGIVVFLAIVYGALGDYISRLVKKRPVTYSLGTFGQDKYMTLLLNTNKKGELVLYKYTLPGNVVIYSHMQAMPVMRKGCNLWMIVSVEGRLFRVTSFAMEERP